MKNIYALRRGALLAMLLCLLSSVSWAQQRVSGTVTSAGGETLPGVNVLIQGSAVGTITDVEGKYVLDVPNPDNTVLVFSSVGFISQEVPLNGRTVLDLELEDDVQALQEVIVTALGIKREEKALGYAVSTVDAQEITRSGNTNFASALYGKAPGVKITTAPGGATSAVNVQIRGINSLNYNSQPLYVVDGIIIRNTNEKPGGINNGGYWDDQKIRGNGILDINPQDIESLTVLKGASATALYGSEAASGVIVITTKKGTKGKGLGVDLNYYYNVEQVAFTPKYQNVYGPGYPRDINAQVGADAEGWIPVDADGDGVAESKRPNYRAYGQFGPKMDGQPVTWWDGTIRPYSAQPDNFKDFYQLGYNSTLNAAVSNSNEFASYRLSYTRMDYEGIARGSKLQRNTFNLNSSFKLNDKVSVDIVANYFNSYVHNRPEQLNRITANYGGFFSRADDMSVYLDKYKTSQGYKYVPYNLTERNPDEALLYNIRANDVLDYLWRNLRNSEDEYQDRLLTSATLNYDIVKNFRFRGRVGNDLTSREIENKQYNEYPLTFNGTNSTGYYGVSTGRYSILYGDFLFTYTQPLGEESDLSVSAGMQGRDERYRDQSNNTEGGLIEENWFSLTNSVNTLRTSASRSLQTKYAYIGLANLNIKNVWFLEGTARQEYSSTLPPGSNRYLYGSLNSSFVFSDAFRLPAYLSYGKVRASYGVVGNAPPIYEANVTYTQTPLQTGNGSVPALASQARYGNNAIQPENKYEMEFGAETRWLNDRFGLDITYYNSRIVDQILQLSLPTSTGASSILVNVGELRSNGLEIGLNATPIRGPLTWNLRLNYAKNVTKVHSLMEGVDRLNYYNADGGAVQVVAEKGRPLGDILVHPRQTDENGNFVIGDNGLYIINSNEYEKAGNILPKAVGGMLNTFTYGPFSLDLTIDYRFGGQLVSPPLLYATGAGMFESTLEFRDEENGGLPYYINSDNVKVQLPSHDAAAPDGSTVFHDGMILEGVDQEGNPNTTIVDAPSYYFNTFTWGSSGWYGGGAVYDNSYIKLREATLSYQIPTNLASKLKLQNVRVALIGRNLFYIWRTLKNLDPEAAIGSRWDRQGIDEGSGAANRSYGISLHANF
ncbi:iron complex outermembrane recepter protein [Catalinimonas alkaloidigena]|uniref:Iron complex outermembrane recepter protein n=1 Tax=Catalinimonas alkaloidigena TaxID=1075417 RepID=A0A1G9HCZ0_9BACT|nr:SusC/RagA family TonB-linked outer membrane protein [Catalinimonas alkaloidigena]SDL10696.1 iron complex outermembrane recepter protein [Catalinimonas alkaloidigena]